MLGKIARLSGLVAIVLSFPLAADALAACWVCAEGSPPPGCSRMCQWDPTRRGYTSCTDACSSCIVSGSCNPFVPQTLEADGTAIEEPAPDPLAGLFARAVAVRRPVLFAGLGALVAEAASRLDTVRRTCQGMIVQRVVSRGRGHEIRLHARRILV